MHTKADETAIARSVPDEVAPPPDPVELARLLLQQLAAFPWVGFGAIGSGFGVALLAFYFRSIDFVPPDIPSVLGASVFVAMLAFALSVWVVVSLVGPLWMYREMGLPPVVIADGPAAPRAAALGLPALQLLGVGLFLLLWIGVPAWRECRPYAGAIVWIGAALTLLGAAGWGWSEWKIQGMRPVWWKRLHRVLWVCVGGVLPVGALLALLWPGQGGDGWHLGLLAMLWLCVVMASAFLGRFPVWACVLMATVSFPGVVMSLSVAMGKPSLFPTKVAEIAGIRSSNVIELRAPASTCLLLQSALGTARADKPLNCDGSEWGSAHAQVLSNLGARWLIEIPLAGDQPQGRNGALQLTVPAEGLHITRQTPAATSSAAHCNQ